MKIPNAKILAGVAMLMAAGITAQAQFTYTTNNGTITITGYTSSVASAVTIPSTIDGLLVTDIGTNAFQNSILTSVIIPDSVTNIGDYAFADQGDMANVSIGNGVVSLGAYAFAGGGALQSIRIPGSVVTIGDHAFFGQSLTNAVLGNSVASIGDYAFSGLRFTPLPEVGGSYPSGCFLSSVTLPGSVTNIGSHAFYFCAELTNFMINDGAISIGDFALAGTRLANITVPESVTSIGSDAFSGPLTTIDVAPANPAYASIAGVLFNASQTTLVEYPAAAGGSYNIPNFVTNIGDYAFYDCGNLTNITIGSNVIRIGAYAFSGLGQVIGNPQKGAGPVMGCPLTSVTIPSSVTTIGDSAFFDCNHLTNITLGDGLTSIGDLAFSSTRLTNVTIPDSVTNIGLEAFADCSDLTAISVAPSNPAYSSLGGVLFNKSATTLLKCPGGLEGSYAVPTRVTSIESNAFQSIGLTSVTVPGSITNIGPGAFEYCSGLTNLSLSFGLTDIGSNAFNGCINLTTVTIPDSVLSIGDYAFFDCSGLTNITFGRNLTTIGAYAFTGQPRSGQGGSNGGSGGTGGGSAPLGCPLTRITISDSVTEIGDYAFAGCQSLTNIDFLGNAPDADATVFSWDSLTAYYLPGTTGWPQFTTNTGVPTALWTLPYPLVLNGSSGVLNNQFGFTISWATNVPVVVEASADLSNPVWTPVATNTLSNGTSSFTDPDWTNYPNRFYRLPAQ